MPFGGDHDVDLRAREIEAAVDDVVGRHAEVGERLAELARVGAEAARHLVDVLDAISAVGRDAEVVGAEELESVDRARQSWTLCGRGALARSTLRCGSGRPPRAPVLRADGRAASVRGAPPPVGRPARAWRPTRRAAAMRVPVVLPACQRRGRRRVAGPAAVGASVGTDARLTLVVPFARLTGTASSPPTSHRARTMPEHPTGVEPASRAIAPRASLPASAATGYERRVLRAAAKR